MLFYVFGIITYLTVIKVLNEEVRKTQLLDRLLEKESKYNKILMTVCIVATVLVLLFGNAIVGFAGFIASVTTIVLLLKYFHHVRLNVIGKREQWCVFLALTFRFVVIITIMEVIMLMRVAISH